MHEPSIIKTPDLVANRLYFGVEARRLRDATDRVLARVVGLARERATVPLRAIAEDFRLDSDASRAFVESLVSNGLLEQRSLDAMEYGITERFRVLAQAHLIQPPPRADAQLIVSHVADVAAAFNRHAASNNYEIAALAVFGGYRRLDSDLAELSIGVTGRRRPPAGEPSSGRATRATEGTDAIRAAAAAAKLVRSR